MFCDLIIFNQVFLWKPLKLLFILLSPLLHLSSPLAGLTVFLENILNLVHCSPSPPLWPWSESPSVPVWITAAASLLVFLLQGRPLSVLPLPESCQSGLLTWITFFFPLLEIFQRFPIVSRLKPQILDRGQQRPASCVQLALRTLSTMLQSQVQQAHSHFMPWPQLLTSSWNSLIPDVGIARTLSIYSIHIQFPYTVVCYSLAPPRALTLLKLSFVFSIATHFWISCLFSYSVSSPS